MASSKISVMVVSGSREKLQFAAMMTSVAAVSGNEVTVFLSMNALPYFLATTGGAGRGRDRQADRGKERAGFHRPVHRPSNWATPGSIPARWPSTSWASSRTS